MHINEKLDSETFAVVVKSHFMFLETEYEYSIVKGDNYMLRYENKDVFLVVHYDAERSFELDVEIGQLKCLFNGQERPFTWGEVLRAEGLAEGEKYIAFQAVSCTSFHLGIAQLAQQVSRFSRGYLLNDELSFKRLSSLREFECDQYERERQLVGIRSEAQLAWQKKDYSALVALYEPVESIISEVEKKKLNLARRRVKK